MTPPIAPARPMEILLVEDNAADILLMEEALQEGPVPNRLSIARDGDEALDFLRRHGRHARAPRPDLILLDLNLPKKDGREVLAEVKADSALLRIPVVILTTSESREDILRSYELHANCYITKPVALDGFLEVIRAIEDFWLKIVRLPVEVAAS
jgi:two-component system, chemotaxis family, response regulator Rcp1